ncbi:MAG: hypothetical protein JO007_18910 [Alphaproteobacteria bacterium]|nr:hypothetical protein [Alphaproteobacteria bacterium]
MSRDGEPIAEIIPKGEAKLGTGFGQAEEGITALATGTAARSAADLARDDMRADVALRAVGVERDARPIKP